MSLLAGGIGVMNIALAAIAEDGCEIGRSRSSRSPIADALAPVAIAFTCAMATGLVFGFAPAMKAARLDPVVALASE